MAVNKDEKVTPLVVKREAYSLVLVKFCLELHRCFKSKKGQHARQRARKEQVLKKSQKRQRHHYVSLHYSKHDCLYIVIENASTS